MTGVCGSTHFKLIWARQLRRPDLSSESPFGLCIHPPCRQLLPLICNRCRVPSPAPVPGGQEVEARWATSCCPNQARPQETGQGGSTSALLFSVERTASASPPLQPPIAPHQAWAHVYVHISAPTSGCPHTYFASHAQWEKRTYIHFSATSPAATAAFTEGGSLLSKIACALLCSKAREKSYSWYLLFSPKFVVLF